MMKHAFGLIFLVMAMACTEEEVSPRQYPRVHTLEVTNVTKTSITIRGEIFFSSVPILDHGFVWTNTGFPTITNGTKLSLGPKGEIGTFVSTANTTFETGKTYDVRAYAQSADYVVYGETFRFVVAP